MKVKMLKGHNGHKQGETVEVSDARGRYWIGCSIAETVKKKEQKKKPKTPKEPEQPKTKELKSKPKTKKTKSKK